MANVSASCVTSLLPAEVSFLDQNITGCHCKAYLKKKQRRSYFKSSANIHSNLTHPFMLSFYSGQSTKTRQRRRLPFCRYFPPKTSSHITNNFSTKHPDSRQAVSEKNKTRISPPLHPFHSFHCRLLVNFLWSYFFITSVLFVTSSLLAISSISSISSITSITSITQQTTNNFSTKHPDSDKVQFKREKQKSNTTQPFIPFIANVSCSKWHYSRQHYFRHHRNFSCHDFRTQAMSSRTLAAMVLHIPCWCLACCHTAASLKARKQTDFNHNILRKIKLRQYSITPRFLPSPHHLQTSDLFSI